LFSSLQVYFSRFDQSEAHVSLVLASRGRKHGCYWRESYTRLTEYHDPSTTPPPVMKAGMSAKTLELSARRMKTTLWPTLFLCFALNNGSVTLIPWCIVICHLCTIYLLNGVLHATYEKSDTLTTWLRTYESYFSWNVAHTLPTLWHFFLRNLRASLIHFFCELAGDLRVIILSLKGGGLVQAKTPPPLLKSRAIHPKLLEISPRPT
jgi:hypothetical protein